MSASLVGSEMCIRDSGQPTGQLLFADFRDPFALADGRPGGEVGTAWVHNKAANEDRQTGSAPGGAVGTAR
eukprot:349017-Alexandrium_andersonii.AAC.1